MRNASRWILPFALLAALVPLAAAAQDYDDEAVIRQSVARIAYINGDVSYNRGDDPDAWDAAAINFPMTIGDRVWAARDGRLELQARGANVFVASQTELAALNLTEEVQQYSLTQGTVSVRLHRLDPDDVFEVDTPNAAVTFDRPGSYRIDVDQDGNTRVVIRRGHAYVAAGGGQVPIESGDEMEIDGLDAPTYDVFSAGRTDGWDRWVENRAARYRSVRYAEYVNADVIGWDDLDQYGRWNQVPGYGMCWSPSSIDVDWAPYRLGRWVWEDPWGWSWVSNEPWGFAPYHYGRWVTWSSRWWWVPAERRGRARYSPALVAFVGGGPGWSASIGFGGGGGGYVGWFPLGPRDPFIPWWLRRGSAGAVTNVTYMNRSYATVVQHNVFVSGNLVGRNVIRDPEIVRTVVREPILRGPIPVMPTRASIRVSLDGPRGGVRPPAPIVGRSVVTRLAPPPAPPMFAAKLDVIRENRGAPVMPIEASRLSVERHEGARSVVPIRPATQERVVLQPRRGESSLPRPVAVTAPSGRVLATSERPFIPAPGASGRAERVAPAPPPARGAVVTRGEGGPPPARVERERGGPPVREERVAPPPAREERVAPPPARIERERPAPPPAREERAAPPPAREERVAPPPARVEREHPAPPPAREEHVTPPPAREERPAPPPARVERARPAPPPARVERERPAPPPQREERAAPAPAPRAERPAPPPPREERAAPPAPREERAAPPPPRQERVAPPPPRVERVAPAERERRGPPPKKDKDKDKANDDKKKDEKKD